MATLSIGDAWEGASAFLKREWTLLLPVSLAFVGLPELVTQIMGPKIDPSQGTAVSVQMTAQILPWLAGLTLAGLLGQLAISVLVLVPGVSVGEALGRALRRFPTLIAALALAGAAGFLGMILLTILFSAGGQAGMKFGLGVMMAAGLVLALRLMVTYVVVAAEPVGPVQALRRSWQLTGHHALKLLGFCVVSLAALIALSVVVGAIGSVLRIFDALGGPDLTATVVGILGALVNSVAVMVYSVVTVFLYRQLAGSNSGT